MHRCPPSTLTVHQWNKRRCSWLRYCAIRRKVAGTIPVSIIGIFPSTLSMGSTQLLLEMSKDKGHPATGRGGPRGSGWVKYPDFLDVRHYKDGRSSVLRNGRLYPRRNPWYSFSEAESSPGHMVPSEATEKSPVTPPEMDPGTSRLVAQYLKHYATPDH